MNKLNAQFNFPVPLEWDDFDWLQESVRNALYGLLSAFGITAEESFKISGCEVLCQGYEYTTTAGYISLEGEILQVDAHMTGLAINEYMVWQVESNYDVNGEEIDIEGNTVQCYEVRKAKLVAVPDGNGMMPWDALHLTDVIYEKIKGGFEGVWVYIALSAGFTSNPNDLVRIRKNVLGQIEIKGSFNATSNSGVLLTLPDGYKPNITRKINFYPGLNLKFLFVDANGDIWADQNVPYDTNPGYQNQISSFVHL